MQAAAESALELDPRRWRRRTKRWGWSMRARRNGSVSEKSFRRAWNWIPQRLGNLREFRAQPKVPPRTDRGSGQRVTGEVIKNDPLAPRLRFILANGADGGGTFLMRPPGIARICPTAFRRKSASGWDEPVWAKGENFRKPFGYWKTRPRGMPVNDTSASRPPTRVCLCWARSPAKATRPRSSPPQPQC